MITVVAAVIERSDRRLLIGQRRKGDTSPLKWEFPGGKVREGESPEVALARELQEELGATLLKALSLAACVINTRRLSMSWRSAFSPRRSRNQN